MKLALIPCGLTDWHGAGRLLGRAELSLSDDEPQRFGEWVEELRALGLQRIVHAPDDLSTQTAKALARPLSIPTKSFEDLREVDIGLWAGLTEAELKTRYARAHRQLRESPLNVSPPGGEDLDDAVNRLSACIRKQLKKNGGGALGIVMRPFSFAMARSAFNNQPLTNMLEAARATRDPIVIDVDNVERVVATD